MENPLSSGYTAKHFLVPRESDAQEMRGTIVEVRVCRYVSAKFFYYSFVYAPILDWKKILGTYFFCLIYSAYILKYNTCIPESINFGVIGDSHLYFVASFSICSSLMLFSSLS